MSEAPDDADWLTKIIVGAGLVQLDGLTGWVDLASLGGDEENAKISPIAILDRGVITVGEPRACAIAGA